MNVKSVLMVFGVVEIAHLTAKAAFHLGKKIGWNEAVKEQGDTREDKSERIISAYNHGYKAGYDKACGRKPEVWDEYAQAVRQLYPEHFANVD